MNRWSALAILLAFAGALAFRLPRLDTRPLHNDEAVNAFKVADLWEQHRYQYDPDEYHGPTLHYFTLPFLWASSAKSSAGITDSTLRLAPVFFGAALILLLPLFAGAVSNAALAWAALFIAISPAMVFYSRYFIHEMLLVFFTALGLGAAWRYAQRPSLFWAAPIGAAAGLMFATKETFVLTIAAAIAALLIQHFLPGTKRARIPGLLRRADLRWHAACALLSFGLVWLIFFSSFFTNPRGLLDSIRTYLPWLKRAAGESVHLHPWYFYLERLAWFHPLKGPAWSEGLILVLAVIGGSCAFLQKASFPRFLALFTLLLTAVYSVISYKTPWCLLSFFFGMILLAGLGAEALLQRLGRFRLAGCIVLLLAAVQLGWQSWRASYVFASDRRNPYVYAQAVPDIQKLVERVEAIAKVSPDGKQTIIKIIAPKSDYWPLPWYLRTFPNTGWYENLPAGPYAPIVIVAARLEAKLDEKSDRKWIMAGMTELRPGKFFELYVELELWKKFVETLPPEPD